MLHQVCRRHLARTTLRFITLNNRNSSNCATANTFVASAARTVSFSRPISVALAIRTPLCYTLQRYASTVSTPDGINQKKEKDLSQQKLQPHPEEVTATSTVNQVFREKGAEEEEEDEDMFKGVWDDIRIIKETLALNEVPREALFIGMAGVLPYLATSLSTIYLAWDISYAASTGHGFLVSGQTAELLLHIVEPLQMGYGAVIISFLGAIHWGLEFAKYGGVYGYKRYAYGVVAPAVAWPTLLLPIEYALISQFFAFVLLYYADAQAVTQGRAPHWYTTYRFVLTFIVGTSIVASLIGRGKITDKIGKLPGPADRVKALRDSQMASLEYEEREKMRMRIEQDELQGANEDDEDEDDDE